MSSNKKTKIDFREALKARQPDMKKKQSMERVTVELNGVPVEVLRGKMTDSEWAPIKARELSDKAVESYEETGALPKVDKAAERQAEKDAQFQEETGSARPISGKMTTVPDDGAGGPRADASMDDPQRTEHVERLAANSPDMGMAVSARNPAGIISQLATGAAPQNVSQAPTDLVPADMGMTPAEAMAPPVPVETVTTPTGDVIEKPPPPPEAVPPPPPKQPPVRTLEPMTMDAGGPPPEEPFKLPSVKEGLTGLAQAQIKSLEGAQAIAEKQAEAEKALRQQHIIDSLQAQAHQKEVQDAYNSKMDQLERAGIDLRDQMMEASRATVDPNRYWANKDAGQKAAAVIAGALFGFTGQGMQWLQRLDGLVAQDMQAQAADLANRGHMLQAAAGQNNNLIAQLKSRGVEGMAAYQTGMALMKEDLANRIELMKLNTSSANARAMLDEKKSQLLADAAINAQKAQQAQETHALNSAKTIAEIQKLRADAAQSASPRPKSLSELTIARHDSIKNSLAGLEELKASFDRLKGGASALGRAGQVVKAHAPLLGSEEKAYNTQVQLLASEVAKARSATGTTSENDEKKAVEDLFKAGDSVAEQKYNALKRDLERRLKQSEASLQAGGFDTSSTVAPSGMVPVRPPMKASK